MPDAPSRPCVSCRTLLATVLLVGLVAVAGCSTTTDYTTSVDEPTNGTVIDGLSVYDINELDGVRYELQYSRTSSDDATYDVKVYELTSGSPEFVSVSDLDQREPVYRNNVSPPWDAGDERRYELRVVRESDGTVADAITFTVSKSASDGILPGY